jgi:hypothetical protein
MRPRPGLPSADVGSVRTVTLVSCVEVRDLLYAEMDKRYIKKDHYPERQFCRAAIAKGGQMSDDAVDIAAIDVTGLSEGDLKALANSVLGHALQRRLAIGVGQDNGAPDPIAAHESHV